MSMIVIGHFLYHGITEREMSRFLYVLICTYCSVGVNLFFLISGYFRIRSVMKSIARLVFTVLFFDCVNYMLLYFTAGPAALYDWIPTLFFPVSRSPYWFLQVYLFLIICSPLINRGIDGMTLNKLRLFILFFRFSLAIVADSGIMDRIQTVIRFFRGSICIAWRPT